MKQRKLLIFLLFVNHHLHIAPKSLKGAQVPIPPRFPPHSPVFDLQIALVREKFETLLAKSMLRSSIILFSLKI
jgi:hypothetical protein